MNNNDCIRKVDCWVGTRTGCDFPDDVECAYRIPTDDLISKTKLLEWADIVGTMAAMSTWFGKDETKAKAYQGLAKLLVECINDGDFDIEGS